MNSTHICYIPEYMLSDNYVPSQLQEPFISCKNIRIIFLTYIFLFSCLQFWIQKCPFEDVIYFRLVIWVSFYWDINGNNLLLTGICKRNTVFSVTKSSSLGASKFTPQSTLPIPKRPQILRTSSIHESESASIIIELVIESCNVMLILQKRNVISIS